MKLKTILSASAVMMIALASCKKDNPVTPVPESKDLDIKVSASLYQFTKATDTAFEENDNIGLFILTPETYLDNAKFTVNNAGALVPAKAYKWYDNKDLEAALAGYYPYNENWKYGTEMTFTVNADQSTAALYTASDLMLAAAKSKPTENAVALPFKHVLSKIIVTVDNQLEGDEEIADVYFSEIYGQVTLDPKDATTITSSGSKGTVKAFKGTGNTWSLIVAPQTEVSPKLIITTKSEKQYTYVLEESVNLNSGKYSTAEVVLNDESIYTSFTASIEDWVADNELNFNQDKNADPVLPEQPAETILYLQVNDNWASANARMAVYSWNDEGDNWTDMTDANSDGIWKVILPQGHTNFIFCRMNPGVSYNRWNKDDDTDETKPLWSQSTDMQIPAEGNCFVMDASAWDKYSEDSPWAGTWKTIEPNE